MGVRPRAAPPAAGPRSPTPAPPALPTLAPPPPVAAADPTPVPAVAPRFGYDPPRFRPHAGLRGGHAQTLAGVFWAGREEFPAPAGATAATHTVDLGDGDAAALHETRPPRWRPAAGAALLVHGLGGCRNSPYMVRIAAKLAARGVRAFRLDHRTCGDGAALSARTYHAGLSADVRAALAAVHALCPDSPLGVAGFSMGGNMVLKALGEHGAAARGGDPAHRLPDVPLRAVAVNPAADLAACCAYLTGPMQRFYDWRFARYLVKHVAGSPNVCRDRVAELLKANPRRIAGFDAALTVPAWGFDDVQHYYAAESAAPLAEHIGAATPTLALTAADDPLVPASVVDALPDAAGLTKYIAAGGGHLGFIARRRRGGRRGEAYCGDPDRRWMDWRVVDWLTAAAGPPAAASEAAAPATPARLPARPR